MELSAAFLSFQRYTRQVPQFGKGEGRTLSLSLSISGSLNFRLAWHAKGGKGGGNSPPPIKKESLSRMFVTRGIYGSPAAVGTRSPSPEW